MGSTTRRLLTTAVATFAGIALTIPTALADPGGQPNDHAVAAHRAATTPAEQQRVADYWTADRMRSAIPAETRFGHTPARATPTKGKPTRSGSAVAESTQPELGKVFFTMGGLNYVCSGTATGSSNGDVVTTAGHCVNEGPGAFATNFAFVPAYLDGEAPYGKWTASELFTSEQWATAGDFDYDVGFASLNENAAGKSLTEVVGSYPIAFNLARGLTYTSYGYPAAKPYDGQSLWSCTGEVVQDVRYGSTDQGLECSMTGGSSGGGWITDGQLNSVNSFKYRGDKKTMWGPYFGSDVEQVYRTAASS